MAVKKAGGSTKNGRQSKRKRLGVKIFGNQQVKAGGVILRQRGSKYINGENTTLGRDFTINSTISGFVVFGKRNNKKIVRVVKAL